MREIGPPVKQSTAQADGVLRNPAEFWAALDNDLKPAVTYTATLAVDLDLFRTAAPVRTTVIELGDRDGARRHTIREIGGIVRTAGTAAGGAGQPVSGAEVAFPGLGIVVRSDDAGRYVVPRAPEGTHRVVVATGAGQAREHEVQVPSPSYDLEV
jgi:hypothetical protein